MSAIEAGRHLCEELLEPLICYFWGGSASAFGYRSKELNQICNEKGHNCGKDNAASHTWDELKSEKMGAMACIVVHWYLDLYEETGDFRPLTW